MKAITGAMQMFSSLVLGCDPRALEEALRELPRADLEKVAARINAALASPCRQDGDSDRCVGCGEPAADYCAAQCVGPFHESGCGEALWMCGECVRRDTNATNAIVEFTAKHEGHVPESEAP